MTLPNISRRQQPSPYEPVAHFLCRQLKQLCGETQVSQIERIIKRPDLAQLTLAKMFPKADLPLLAAWPVTAS
jgi:hypothetical protein